MKKFACITALLILTGSLFAQDDQNNDPPTVERMGTRTSESVPYPVLYYEQTPEQIPNGRHTVTFPSLTADDTVKWAMYHLIVYLSYYAPSDAGINYQMKRFQKEIVEKGKYNLTIVTPNASGVVSQIFMTVTPSKAGTFGLAIQYVFVPEEYRN
jgi:hypothetical protein